MDSYAWSPCRPRRGSTSEPCIVWYLYQLRKKTLPLLLKEGRMFGIQTPFQGNTSRAATPQTLNIHVLIRINLSCAHTFFCNINNFYFRSVAYMTARPVSLRRAVYAVFSSVAIVEFLSLYAATSLHWSLEVYLLSSITRLLVSLLGLCVWLVFMY